MCRKYRTYLYYLIVQIFRVGVDGGWLTWPLISNRDNNTFGSTTRSWKVNFSLTVYGKILYYGDNTYRRTTKNVACNERRCLKDKFDKIRDRTERTISDLNEPLTPEYNMKSLESSLKAHNKYHHVTRVNHDSAVFIFKKMFFLLCQCFLKSILSSLKKLYFWQRVMPTAYNMIKTIFELSRFAYTHRYRRRTV